MSLFAKILAFFQSKSRLKIFLSITVKIENVHKNPPFIPINLHFCAKKEKFYLYYKYEKRK